MPIIIAIITVIIRTETALNPVSMRTNNGYNNVCET